MLEVELELELELDELALLVELEAVVVALVSVRFEEYFRVMLVTLMRRYFRLALCTGASAR